MNQIKSSYNFVPVEEDDSVFIPEWGEKVSLDVPFENNYSGEMEYELKAETPVFVRGHDGNFVQQHGGRYFLPATTVKGCFRSVLEILSYGHLGERRIGNEKFSFRDLQDSRGYMSKMKEVYCGWLVKEGGYLVVRNYAKPHRISYSELRSKVPNIENLTVEKKYKEVKRRYPSSNGYIYDKFTEPIIEGGRGRRTFCRFGGHLKGFVVFSGSISGKKNDFVLLEEDMETDDLIVTQNAWDSFKELYKEYKDIDRYDDHSYSGRLVFFTIKNIGGIQMVGTMGLNYLHKYIAKNDIRTAIPKGLKKEEADLADIIFGSEKHFLKGRVRFSHAFSDNAELLYKDGDSIMTVLGSPKASYYPTYLQGSNTWDSSNALISGYKRYPIKPRFDISALNLLGTDNRGYSAEFPNDTENLLQFRDASDNTLIPRDETDGKINFATVTKLRPLKEGSLFKGRVQFFNLKKEELGALLAAMTFLGREEECKHSIGAAKAMGFGAMSIKVNTLKKANGDIRMEDIVIEEKGQIMDSFKGMMEMHTSGWEKSARVKELIAMAIGLSDGQLQEFISPMQLKNILTNGRVGSQFAEAKLELHKGNAEFARFSKLKDGAATVHKSMISSGMVKRVYGEVSREEKKKGWDLELKKYNGIVRDNKKIGVNNPTDKHNFSRTIYCTFEQEAGSQKNISPDTRVQFEILEINKDSIVIRILNPRN